MKKNENTALLPATKGRNGNTASDADAWWTLRLLQVFSETGQLSTATVALEREKINKSAQDAATGAGPTEAVVNAINRVTEADGRPCGCGISAEHQGAGSIFKVSISVEFGSDGGGETVLGQGDANPNLMEAYALAYLNAVNRYISQGLVEVRRRKGELLASV